MWIGKTWPLMVSCPYWHLVKQGLHGLPLVTGSGNPIRPAPMGARAATPHHTDWTDQHDGMIARGEKDPSTSHRGLRKVFCVNLCFMFGLSKKAAQCAVHTYKSRKWKCSMLWVICVKKWKDLQMTLNSITQITYLYLYDRWHWGNFEKIWEDFGEILSKVVFSCEEQRTFAVHCFFFALLAPT